MMDYFDLGVTTFLIRGYEPIADAVGYGRLVTRVRELVAERDRPRPGPERLSARPGSGRSATAATWRLPRIKCARVGDVTGWAHSMRVVRVAPGWRGATVRLRP